MRSAPLLKRIGLTLAILLACRPGLLQADPPFKKVFIVILENTNYDDALKQPFLKSLAERGALLSNYSGVTHPSQGNYVALTSGDLHGVKGDLEYNLNVSNIIDLLERQSKTWKVYADGYPGSCFAGMKSGRYVRKHNPMITYANVRGNPVRCSHIVPSGELQGDVLNDRLPDFALYIPDLDNDGHDTGVQFADRWLGRTFFEFLISPSFTKDRLFIVTFDESATYVGNHLLTIFVGDMVKPGVVINQSYNHYSLLRTIEEAWGLGTLGRRDASARPITGYLK